MYNEEMLKIDPDKNTKIPISNGQDEFPACFSCGGNGWIDDYYRGAGSRCLACNGTGNGPETDEQSER
jgi:hypothetical protein